MKRYFHYYIREYYIRLQYVNEVENTSGSTFTTQLQLDCTFTELYSCTITDL